MTIQNCRRCGKSISFDVPYPVCAPCSRQPSPRKRAEAASWCPICRDSIRPGQNLKLNYGSGIWIHVWCTRPTFRPPVKHYACRTCGKQITYRGGRCTPCTRNS